MSTQPVASKRPPPEKPEEKSLRTKVILSFWAVIILLGLPTWWRTTSIYRARLPLQEMLNWADGQNGLPMNPLEIWVSIPGVSCSEAIDIIKETQQALDDLNEYPVVHQRLRLVQDLEFGQISKAQSSPPNGKCGERISQLKGIEPALKILLEGSETSFSFAVQPRTPVALVRPSLNARSNIPTDLSRALHALFATEQIATALQVTSHTNNNQNAVVFLKSQPNELVTEIDMHLSRALKSSPTYHLTFSLFTAGGTPSSWDIKRALDSYIQPLVHALSATADFSVTTQIQLFSVFSPSVPLYMMQGRNGTFLKQPDLTAFVNAAEWPLSPSIGTGPTLNFILYVPARDQIPMVIEDAESTSWLVPQWGGITIANPPLSPNLVDAVPSVPDQFSSDLLEDAFETFAAQLLSLLGVLPSGSNGQMLTMPLRLQAHKRLSALTLHMKAASSLGSLARLAQHLSSIPIPKHVAQLVDNAIANLTAANTAFRESRLDEALSHAKYAYQDSEIAFFDKSMVGQVYFPDEHKVAVYLPLLGPIGVPLLVGLLREVKSFLTFMKSLRS